MSLLSEIQDSAIDPKTDILIVLRKCRILASRLNHADLKQWVDNELDGYADAEALPPYRVIPTISLGHFSGPFGSGLRNASIPLICVPEKLRPLVENARLTQSISALADIAANREEDSLRLSWPPEMLPLVGRRIYQNMNLMQAWQVLTRATLVGVVETARNKVLTFALEIESASADGGQNIGPSTLPNDRVSQVFHTVIMGNVGNYATGSHDFSQNVGTVIAGDFSSLKAALADMGVEPEEIGELEKAVSKDKRPSSTKQFGSRVSGWIGKMVAKSAQGVWRVSISVASEMLTKMLASYYGLPA